MRQAFLLGALTTVWLTALLAPPAAARQPAARPQPGARRQPAAPDGDPAKGKAAFERTGCWECHGHQGQGGRDGPRVADPVPMAWPAMTRFVRNSRRNMPPYTEKVLSDRELADIYAYLQSIPTAPDYTTIPLLNGKF